MDDCSDDGSYQVLLEYQKKDERIQVFSNSKRMGAAYTRNFGLKLVDTKYVKFLDADGEFLRHPFCFEQLSIENQLRTTNVPWGFMIRSAFLKEQSLEFQSLPSRNDVYFLEMAKMLSVNMGQ